ncbi:hypothetical protein F4680DRAFT_439501, partial [Xylaria scruposa]
GIIWLCVLWLNIIIISKWWPKATAAGHPLKWSGVAPATSAATSHCVACSPPTTPYQVPRTQTKAIVCTGLYGSVRVCTGLYGSVQVYTGLYRCWLYK